MDDVYSLNRRISKILWNRSANRGFAPEHYTQKKTAPAELLIILDKEGQKLPKRSLVTVYQRRFEERLGTNQNAVPAAQTRKERARSMR